jgi:hypothetical protein
VRRANQGIPAASPRGVAATKPSLAMDAITLRAGPFPRDSLVHKLLFFSDLPS